jgi:hypothetical protein
MKSGFDRGLAEQSEIKISESFVAGVLPCNAPAPPIPGS